jgi:histidine triad (HIT) family protein
MNSDCIFCKIINQEIPSEKVYEDDFVYAFKDINPVAPVHILFVPKKHFSSLNDMSEVDESILGKLLLAVKKVAMDKGVDKSGYRTIINTNKDAGQVVFHIHVHLLAGKKLGHMC